MKPQYGSIVTVTLMAWKCSCGSKHFITNRNYFSLTQSQLIHYKEQKAIPFVSNQIYLKFTLKNVQVTQTKVLFPQNGKTTEHSHEPLLFLNDTEYMQGGWKNLLYHWMQLSVACLVPYSSVLFHSYSLLNIAVRCTPDLWQSCISLAYQTQYLLHTKSWQSYSLLCISLAHQTQNQSKMELMSIKLYFLLQCWQDVITVKCAKLL